MRGNEQVLKVWKLLGMLLLLFRIVYPRGHHIHDLSCHDIHDLSWYSQLLLSWYQWCLCHDIHDLSCVVSGHGIHDIHDVRSHDIHDVRSHDRTDLEYWKVWRSLGKCWKVLQSLEKEPSHGHALKLDFESRFKFYLTFWFKGDGLKTEDLLSRIQVFILLSDVSRHLTHVVKADH